MIDGAHVLTPGVLRYGLAGLQTYAPAVVATQQWYMGPGEQGDMIAEGYSTEVENRLFDSIDWPNDGYRLFDVGHFIGERDWLDGMWESNCVFASRDQLAQVGAFDEAFSMAGGGYANLDLYERLASSPDVRLATILGEGSFHQVHGGATTNLPDIADRHFRLSEYARHFEDLRGRPFRGPRKQLHYVGTMRPEAARTRPRRRSVPNPFKAGVAPGGGVPTEPHPLPRELRQEFTEAYWNTLNWQETEWLDQSVPRPPADLFAYQEILSRVRPGHVVEIGSGNGGRAFFLATIFDLLGEGQVVSIDPEDPAERVQHPRVTYVVGDTLDPAIIGRVQELVGPEPDAVLILGSRTSAYRTTHEFRAYQSLVPLGSYAVFEDTVVNGHPVWTEFGPGPSEAVRGIVEARSDFASDLSMGKYAPSFNPGGFLKRVR
jgi:cephalosporin hydroxylase